MFMNRLLAVILALFSAVALAQTVQLKSGSTIFIEPMDGYETYLAAAIVKMHVPLVVVMNKDKADYIITSSVSHQVPSQPEVVVNDNDNSINKNAVNSTNVNNGNNDAWNQGWALGAERARERRAHKEALGSTSVSISIVDPRSSQIVFAYSAGKEGNNQLQKTAEACAKILKEFIEKSEKKKK
jgi:hypothetical protein